MYKVIALNCPGCNAPISTDQERCSYCQRPIIIQKISQAQALSPNEMTKYVNAYTNLVAENPEQKRLSGALAVCYIHLKMYDKAIEIFNKIMDDNVDNPDLFFNLAVCHLRGKKPFSCPRSDINAAINYADVANRLQPQAIAYLLLSYIKYDYFERKYLQIKPSWVDELMSAISHDASEETFMELAAVLNMQLPKEITDRYLALKQPEPEEQKQSQPNKNIFKSLLGKIKKK